MPDLSILAKVMMVCIGKYLDGSGTKVIWTNNQVVGVNVAVSIINATQYKTTFKGLCLLSECLERLQWCEFFSEIVIDHKRVLPV